MLHQKYQGIVPYISATTELSSQLAKYVGHVAHLFSNLLGLSILRSFLRMLMIIESAITESA
jgi:hypothetical protein